MSTPAIRPTSRYQSLDVLRGLAILGTLGTNIWIFTSPWGLLGYLTDPGGAGVPPGWAELRAVLQQLAQGKFLGLLTLMFGIGLEIQRRSALRAGRPWPGRYPWRAGLLLLDGALHFLLVAEFDVLMGYAVTGIVVAYLLATSERSQRGWLVLAATAHVVLLTLLTAALLLLPTAAAAPPSGPNPYADGSFADLVTFRLNNLVLFRLEPAFIGAFSVAMFLAGVRLVRAGVLEPAGHRLRVRLMAVGAAAFALDLVLGLAGEAVLPGTDGATAGLLLSRYGTASIVAFGVLALVTEIVLARPRAGFLRRRLVDVGRMALSCYVLQNLVASALCYGWGLGLAARLSPAQQVPGTIALYLVVAVVVAAAATLWLRRFPRGPLELAWQWCFDRLDRAIPPRRRARDEFPAPARSVP
jgi:uncharacterized protein